MFLKYCTNKYEGTNINLDPSQKALIATLEKTLKHSTKHNSCHVLFYIKSLFNKSSINHNQKFNGLYVYSDVGRGKSMILKDFFSFIPGNRKITSHFHEFMTNTHKTLHRKQGNNRKSSIQMFASQLAKEYDFLLLDELQINNIADAMIVGRLFKAIIEAGVIVFFTSNRHPDDLFKNGLHRDRFLPFIDFIKQKLQIFSLDGDIDYRMRDFNFHNAYFINKHIAIANTELEQELKLLIGDHKTFPQTISLYENRSITIHNTLERIAIFSFAQICETEMGVLDYLGICNHFNIIIIKNIPQFSENMHNEALRFITLIDCLYENHVKLMASFHSPIEELCSKGKHAFEFSRTISRLQEMQTSKYFKSYRKIDDTKYALDAV